MNTGAARRRKLCPEERMTMSSLEPERREKHMSAPRRTAMGKVYTTILGSARIKIFRADTGEAPYLVT